PALATTPSYSRTGNASRCAAYTAVAPPVTTPPSHYTTLFRSDPTADTTYENGESVVLTLTGGSTNGQAVTLGTTVATGTISNDGADATASVTLAPTEVAGHGPLNIVNTVSLDHASAFDTTLSF